MNALHRITKARIAVSNQVMFLSSLVYRLIPQQRDDLPTTTATDGIHFFYNAAAIDDISDADLRADIEHETLHCALGCFMRRGDRDRSTWNTAHDYAINQLASFKQPAYALPNDPRFRGMSAERIYEILKRDQKPCPKGCGCLLEPAGDDGKPLSEAQQQALSESWQLATIQAANQARAAGKLPEALERIVGELKRPLVNWRDVLQRFMRDRIRSDYSLIPPNRRYIHRGLYLHSIAEEHRLGRIADVFDTSGSIYAYPDLLAQFLGEQRAIVQDLRPELVTMIECDAEIHRATDYQPDEFPESIELLGGGGTDFRPPFQHIEENDLEPECMLYFTDLQGTFPDDAPPYPVLWIVYGESDIVPPFGEVVHIR